MADQYYQCKLVQMKLYGAGTTIAWIEKRGAKEGATVTLLPSRELWKVAEVYTHGLPAEVIKDMERNYRAGMPSTRDTTKDKCKKRSS